MSPVTFKCTPVASSSSQILLPRGDWEAGRQRRHEHRVDSQATPTPHGETSGATPRTSHMSGTNITATRQRSRWTEGRGGPHHCKGEGAGATGKAAWKQGKQQKQEKATSAFKVSHQFLLSLFLFCLGYERHEKPASRGERLYIQFLSTRSKWRQGLEQLCSQ